MRYQKIFLLMVLLMCLTCLTGCFSSHPADIAAFDKPDQVIVTSESYMLQPPDEVEVHCSKVPEIDGQRQRIRPDGKISFEALGEFEAAGKTPEELADELKVKVIELYTLVGDKPIEIRLIAYYSKVYYVLGQVYRPGAKVYTGRDSVLTALAEAQPNPMAWLERVQVIKPSSDKKVKPKIFEVNFDRMMAHGDTSKDVLLQEGDIIYVPPTVLAAISMKIEEAIRPLARAFSGAYMIQTGPTGVEARTGAYQRY